MLADCDVGRRLLIKKKKKNIRWLLSLSSHTPYFSQTEQNKQKKTEKKKKKEKKHK
jgi:hypothetical protein